MVTGASAHADRTKGRRVDILVWAAVAVVAILAMAGIREKMARSRVPQGLEGAGIALVIAGIMALAFMGFNGMMNLS